MSSRAKNAPQNTLARPDSGDQIQTVTAGTFTGQVLNGRGPSVVEFMSYSCAYCGNLEPLIQEAARRLAGREKIFRVNIAAEPGLAERYGIEGTPTLVLFQDGEELDRLEGQEPDLDGLMAALTGPFGGLA